MGAGVNKVVVAALDPNPIVAGNGIKILKDAGVEVITGVLEEESRKMNEVFNKFIVQEIPFITLKSGIILDGKLLRIHPTVSGLHPKKLVRGSFAP